MRLESFNGQTSSLQSLCIDIADCHHSTPVWTDSGEIVVRNFNIKKGSLNLENPSYTDLSTFNERTRRSEPLPGDLIITREAPMGEVCMIPEGVKCCLGQRMVLIKPNPEKVDNKYLLWALQSEFVQKQIQQSDKTGSIVSNLRIPVLKELKIPRFGESAEKNIGAFLNNVSHKIELNNRINKDLEAMAKLIYDYWFVQFDFPVSQEQAAAMGKPELEGKPYKSSGGKMVYNEQLKREIPEGWEVKPFAEWIKNDKAGDWGKESKQGKYTLKVSCIRGADINGLNGQGEVKAPTRYILEKNSGKLLSSTDCIVEISGGSPTQSTGRLAFITEETLGRFKDPIICSNFCKALSLTNHKSLYNFVYEWNRLYDAGVLFGWEGKTSGIKNLLFDSFVAQYEVPEPPKELMKSFYEKAKPIHSMIQKNLQQNQQLTSLRDWLLPMLMNGQVTVGQAQETISKKEPVAYRYTEGELNIAAEGSGEYGKHRIPSIPPKRKAFAKHVLAGHIIGHCRETQDFTPIKLQKLVHLSEYMMEADLEHNYYYQTAGPYDNKLMNTLYASMKEKKWFESTRQGWTPLDKQPAVAGLFDNYFGLDNPAFTRIMEKLGNASEQQCELISTLYAVWNDRLIKKESISEEYLMADFYAWSERKQAFSEDQVKSAIEWMKDKGFEPRGFGELIKRRKSKGKQNG